MVHELVNVLHFTLATRTTKAFSRFHWAAWHSMVQMSGAFAERSLVYSVLHFPANFNFEEMITNEIFFFHILMVVLSKTKAYSALYSV